MKNDDTFKMRVPRELLSKLKTVAVRRKVSVADLFREGAGAYVSDLPTPEEQQTYLQRFNAFSELVHARMESHRGSRRRLEKYLAKKGEKGAADLKEIGPARELVGFFKTQWPAFLRSVGCEPKKMTRAQWKLLLMIDPDVIARHVEQFAEEKPEPKAAA